jgi:hypothetical protein
LKIKVLGKSEVSDRQQKPFAAKIQQKESLVQPSKENAD